MWAGERVNGTENTQNCGVKVVEQISTLSLINITGNYISYFCLFSPFHRHEHKGLLGSSTSKRQTEREEEGEGEGETGRDSYVRRQAHLKTQWPPPVGPGLH